MAHATPLEMRELWVSYSPTRTYLHVHMWRQYQDRQYMQLTWTNREDLLHSVSNLSTSSSTRFKTYMYMDCSRIKSVRRLRKICLFEGDHVSFSFIFFSSKREVGSKIVLLRHMIDPALHSILKKLCRSTIVAVRMDFERIILIQIKRWDEEYRMY